MAVIGRHQNFRCSHYTAESIEILVTYMVKVVLFVDYFMVSIKMIFDPTTARYGPLSTSTWFKVALRSSDAGMVLDLVPFWFEIFFL